MAVREGEREIEKERQTGLTVSREIPLSKTLLNQAVIRSISMAVVWAIVQLLVRRH